MPGLQVPVIDLSMPEEEAGEAVRAACTDYGFFYVSNHGVEWDLVTQQFEESKKFFSLPSEEKQKILADQNNRGWTPMMEETLDPKHSRQGDTKEGMYFGREVAPDSKEGKLPLHGPNQWPSEAVLPNFRKTTTAYFEALRGLGDRLLRLIALALDEPAEFFSDKFDRAMLYLRPLHYSAQPSKPEEGVFGAGAHSDYGILTILVTDDVPGLQINVGDKWLDVPPIPETFIINLGDMLESWTNGHFRSTVHRVLSSGGRERYSIPFFMEPNFEVVVAPLPQCCPPGRPARYPPTTAGQYLLDKYAATHADYVVQEIPANATPAA